MNIPDTPETPAELPQLAFDGENSPFVQLASDVVAVKKAVRRKRIPVLDGDDPSKIETTLPETLVQVETKPRVKRPIKVVTPVELPEHAALGGALPTLFQEGNSDESTVSDPAEPSALSAASEEFVATAVRPGVDAVAVLVEPNDPGHSADASPALGLLPPSRVASTPVAPTAFADVISGQYDADETDVGLAVPKRVLAPLPESPKLHKMLAQSGFGSRLEMEALIAQGQVTVNNEVAHTGQRVQFGDQIRINGKPIKVRFDPPALRVLAYHKPAGEVVTHDDPQNRPTVFRRLPKLYQGKWQSVGRLDLNTEGLLLFSNSGELANKLMHPRFGLEREYAVRVLGALSTAERERLLSGVQLDDGPAQFKGIEDGGGDGANVWYQVTIAEGRNREVRRMFESVGHAVSRLIRIRYGAMVLPRGLKRGVFMELDESDIASLGFAAGHLQPEARRDRVAREAADGDASRDSRRGRGLRGRNRGRDRLPTEAQYPTAERLAADAQRHAQTGDSDNGDGELRDQPERESNRRDGQSNLQGRGQGANQGRTSGGGQNSNRNQRGRNGQSTNNGQSNSGSANPGQGNFGPGNGDRNSERNAERNSPSTQHQSGARGADEDYDPFEFQPPPSATHESRLPGAGGRNRRGPAGGFGGGGAGGQPDPMQTSLGYIGADSFRRANAPRGGGGGGGGGQGNRGRSGGGGGGSGGGSNGGGRGRSRGRG